MNDFHSFPTIKLEVERMKHTIVCALSEHGAKMDQALREAVEAYCSDDNIARVLNAEAKKCIDEAIREEVRKFFSYTGAGRAALREAVQQHMNEMYPPVEA